MSAPEGDGRAAGWLAELEVLLRRREELWSVSIYFQGASERSPSYGPEDEAAWEEVTREIAEIEIRVSKLAQRLRVLETGPFAAWVAGRRRLHEARIAAPDAPQWEVMHLRGTIERWQRFLHEEYPDLCRWMSW